MGIMLGSLTGQLLGTIQDALSVVRFHVFRVMEGPGLCYEVNPIG